MSGILHKMTLTLLKRTAMNIIAKALDEIKFTIPDKILIESFRDDTPNWRRQPISLDTQIMNKIIKPRVLVDANLVGGQMTTVSLEGLQPDMIDHQTSVYSIPLARTQNRPIFSVLSVSYMPQISGYNSFGGGLGAVAPNSMNAITNVGQKIMDAVSGIPPISNSYVELLNENVVLVRDQYRVSSTYFLRVILANDENLNSINPRSYRAFSKLCALAVKSFIYNKMRIKIDKAFLEGGQELGVFKEIVESFSDSEEQYQTQLNEVWAKVAGMNDVVDSHRMIKLMCNTAI
jgi:hypothetical protein